MNDKNDELQLKVISFDSEEYKQELELRDAVLRKPLGMSIYNDNRESEGSDYHIGAFYNHHLAGVLILTPLRNNSLKMRQFAVEEKLQKMRIGSRMLIYAENFAKSKGYTLIVLNARKTAVEFYEKLGYTKISDEFLEINIPHYKMQKLI